MKILMLFVALSSVAHAQQGKMLSIARDTYLHSGVEKLKEYCTSRRPDLPHDINYMYVCKLQADADCDHGADENKVAACEVVKRVESLEKMIMISDKNLSLVEEIPIGVNLSKPKADEWKEIKKLPVAGKWVNVSIPDINQMSEEEWVMVGKPNKQVYQKTAMEWKNAMNEVNAEKLNLECKVNTDCKLIFYGSNGCVKGHEGYIAVNNDSQSDNFLKALARYNEVQKKAYNDLKVWRGCLAVVQTHEARCQENKCIGVTY